MDNAQSSICVHEAHGMYTISGGERRDLNHAKKKKASRDGKPWWLTEWSAKN